MVHDAVCTQQITDWMEVSEGYSSDQVVQLAAQFGASAKADATQVKGLAVGGQVSLGTALEEAVKKSANGQHKATVSQRFFERANAYRATTCNIEHWLKDGLFETAAERAKAEDQLLELSKQFNQLEADEKTASEAKKKLSIKSTQPVAGLFEHSTLVVAELQATRVGYYELDDNLAAGECLMKTGSYVSFDDHGHAHFRLTLRTIHTEGADFWNQSWVLPNGESHGEFRSEELPKREGQPDKVWNGEFSYTGGVPTLPIEWRGRC